MFISHHIVIIFSLFFCVLAIEKERPNLIRSASSSMRQYLTLWPDPLVETLLKAYSDTHGFQEGTFFGRAQMISDSIYQDSGRWRSPSEVRRKLASLGKTL